MTTLIPRRDAIKAAAAGAILLPAIGVPARVKAAAPAHPDGPRRVLRLAHLTDLHIQPERRAWKGLGACLRHVQSLPDRPDLILTGGDLVMDAFEAGEARTREQWDLLTTVLKDECSLPVEHCLGNHDIWGWHKAKSGTRGDEALWGKRWAVETLGLPGPYRGFDLKGIGNVGWRGLVLDSVAANDDGYIGRLDDEQFEWLTQELQRTNPGTPVLIVSHIPILTATVLLGEPKKGERRVPSSLMHDDSARLRDLFAQHPNVKLCLSGHMHRLDRVDHRAVTYLCNGAVSGNWWKGRHHECAEGYAVIDLFDDGSFRHTYTTYGWEARG